LQGIFRARGYEFELKILPRENLTKNIYNEFCEDHKKPSDKKISVNDFFALLLLGGWNIHSLKRQKFGDAECFVFTSEYPRNSERFEFVVPSDVKVEDVAKGVDEPLKDLIEKLSSKDNFKNFIIGYFKKKYMNICRYYKILQELKETQKD